MHLVEIKILMLKCKDLTQQGCTYFLCWKYKGFTVSASNTLHLSVWLLFPSGLLWLFCSLLACHNLLLTIWEASDPMRRVHWNILELEDWQLCKNVNCFSYCYTGSKEKCLNALSCWVRILESTGFHSEFQKGKQHQHTWRNSRKAPGIVSKRNWNNLCAHFIVQITLGEAQESTLTQWGTQLVLLWGAWGWVSVLKKWH